MTAKDGYDLHAVGVWVVMLRGLDREPDRMIGVYVEMASDIERADGNGAARADRGIAFRLLTDRAIAERHPRADVMITASVDSQHSDGLNVVSVIVLLAAAPRAEPARDGVDQFAERAARARDLRELLQLLGLIQQEALDEGQSSPADDERTRAMDLGCDPR